MFVRQLNFYRYVLENEYDLHVSGMFLGIAHPLRLGPMCIEVPRLDTEISMLVEVELTSEHHVQSRQGVIRSYSRSNAQPGQDRSGAFKRVRSITTSLRKGADCSVHCAIKELEGIGQGPYPSPARRQEDHL